MRAFALRPEPRWVLLGTDTGDAIFRAPWNAATGEIGKQEVAIATARPDFFAMHPTLPVLYSVNSVGDGEKPNPARKPAVSSFRVKAATAELSLLNTVSSHGDGPCYIAVHPTGKALYVANYSAGSFAAYSLAKDGSLVDEPATLLNCHTEPVCGRVGPVSDRQDASHLHCTTLSPDGQYVVVCDLGTDSLLVFPLAPHTALPQVSGMHRTPARPGSGPRHVAFHPNGHWLYCVHELDGTIDLYDWNHGQPTLRTGSAMSTFAKGATRRGASGCELLISPDGRFAYTCNRGVDDVVVYRIEAKSGALQEQQRFPCGGKVPRIFAFDPSRRWLAVCNQSAPGTVAVFAHDPETGHVQPKPKIFAANTPMFLQWL